MSDYNKITDYAAKDSLPQGDAVKRVKGSELGADFDAVAVAVATKANLAAPAFTTGIGVGATAAGAGGIAFPATAVAVADANTLDDYEEGAWTPVPTAISGAFTTVGTVSGTYTKVGRLVSLYYSIIITDKGTGSAGMLVSGLPFAASGYAVGSGYQASNGTQNIVHVVTGTTTLQVFKYDGTDPVVNTQLMRGSVTYFA